MVLQRFISPWLLLQRTGSQADRWPRRCS